MATLEESIAVDLSRWHKAGKSWQWIAEQITANSQIKEGLELRSEKLRKQAGRGLGSVSEDRYKRMWGLYLAYSQSDIDKDQFLGEIMEILDEPL